MVVKTAHSRLPKKFLEHEMKYMPGGCWIILEGRTKKEEVDLVSIGYKYNRKKVLVFVCSKDAATTAAYFAKFPDSFGHVYVCQVAWPAVISSYFDYSTQV